MLTKDEVLDILDPNVEQVAYDYLAESKPMWKTIANEARTEVINSELSMISGLGKASEVGDDDPPIENKPVQGYKASQRQRKFSFDVPIPESTWRFARSADELLSTFSGATAAMLRPVNSRVDNLVADLIANAESKTAPDGQNFASASHPIPNSSSTWSNYLTAAKTLTEANLQAMITKINQCPDLVGEPAELLMNNTARLLVGPANEAIARRLLKSMGLPGTPNNDINPVTQMGLSGDPLVWTRLDSNFDGLDNNDWYIIMEKLGITVVWALEPEFKTRFDNNDTYHFTGKFWCDVIITEPRGLWFANGS